VDKIQTVILAAGKGKRLRIGENDDMPKVMKQAAGRPLLGYVLDAINFIPKADTTVIVGFGRETVEDFLAGTCKIAVQSEQLGTGHAVLCARGALSGFDGAVLVCAGDMPLVESATYLALCEAHFADGNDVTILSSTCENPDGYGRIVRGRSGDFESITEHRDCTDEQLKINEVNSSIYVFDCKKLFSALEEIRPTNAQGEYYLTDAPEILRARGGKVGVFKIEDERQILGINTVEQLELAERLIFAAKG